MEIVHKRIAFDVADKNWIYLFEVDKPFSIEAIVHALRLCEYPIKKIRDTTRNTIMYSCITDDPLNERQFVLCLEEIHNYIRVVVDKDAADVIKILDCLGNPESICS